MIIKKHKIKIPTLEIAKFTGVTIIASGVIFFISGQTIEYIKNVYEFLPQVIPLVILGGTIYFGIMYLIDTDTRKLFKSILKEIRLR